MILRKMSLSLSSIHTLTDLPAVINPAFPPGVTGSCGEEPTCDRRNTTQPISGAPIIDPSMPSLIV